MNIIHVVPAVSNEASGGTYAVTNMCASLSLQGHAVTLAALDWSPSSSVIPFLKTFPLGQGPRLIGRSPALKRWLIGQVEAGTVDVIHNHSLWMFPNIYAGQVARRRNIPLLVSPHGTLAPWALNHSKWRKRFVWAVAQKRAISDAACFHATALSEYEDIRTSGFKQPVCIIPNGIDIPHYRSEIRVDGSPRRLLFLSRIHPVKGIENLIRAWCVVAARHPAWVLDIVGSSDNEYGYKIQRLAEKLGAPRVTFFGPLYGAEKLKAYRAAELFVLPTFSENFGMVVAEALAAGTPAIVTHGAPWQGLVNQKAGWWIEVGVDPLVECLELALGCSKEDLKAMGLRGRCWMEQEFSWSSIGARLSEVYAWVQEGTNKPACVIV